MCGKIKQKLTIWLVAPKSIMQEVEHGKWTTLWARHVKLIYGTLLLIKFNLGWVLINANIYWYCFGLRGKACNAGGFIEI